MDMVPLNNGVNMPMLGLGTYALRGGDCERCVLEALELGYRLFDTAQMYGNEREVGNALRRGAYRAASCSSPRNCIGPAHPMRERNRALKPH